MMTKIATVAAALGLVTGLGEGIGLMLLQQSGELGFRIARVPVWYEILVISPLLCLGIFLATALLLVGAATLLRPLKLAIDWTAVTVFVCSALLWFDWLTVPGRLRLYAVVPLAGGLAAVSLRVYLSRPGRQERLFQHTLSLSIVLALAAFAATVGWPWVADRLSSNGTVSHPKNSPNVVVVVFDTVRADHVSAYGYSRQTTPFLDQLAREGALFENAYSTSSWTLPAHGSLMTGLLPHDHGATTSRLSPTAPTIAEVLSASGYRTAAFSGNVDWFTRREGFGRGFERFRGLFLTPSDMAGRTIYGRMYDEFISPALHTPPLLNRVPAEEINRAALTWLDRGSNDAPFFLVLNYFDAHAPYEPPQPYRHQFSDEPNPGGRLRDVTLSSPPRLTPRQLQDEIDAYDGGIAYLDHELQRLVQALIARKQFENTLLIVLADHGESFGEHGLFTHRTALYRELVRIPMVLRWPAGVPAGVRIQTPVSIIDVPATITDELHLKQTIGHGRSLVSTWTGEDTGRSFPVEELERMPFDLFNWVPAFKGSMRAIVTPEWQYIEHQTLGAELYHIADDPQQLVNVMNTPAGHRVAAALLANLRAQ